MSGAAVENAFDEWDDGGEVAPGGVFRNASGKPVLVFTEAGWEAVALHIDPEDK